MPDRHALLGASSSNIWCNCTPSARLGENIEDPGSEYAAEGTKAHRLCELFLRTRLLGENLFENSGYNDAADVFAVQLLDGTVELFSGEMYECAKQYADFVEEELNAAKAKTADAQLFVEVELDFSEYVPEGFGTSDAVIIADDTLKVIDYKHGKGVAVNAENNTQLRLYALGAYLKFSALYDFKTVETVVFQPRIENIGSETIPVQQMLSWAENYIKPRAKLAFAGEGDFVVGSHCRFCKAGSVCRARVEEAFEIIDRSDTKPALISDEEIPGILDKLDNAEKWIAAIRKYAEDKAIHEGVVWPGYKIVEGRSMRKISDPFRALELLNGAGFSAEEVTTVKLKGLSDLEKTVGKTKFNELLGQLVVKPRGAPTLVKESDKRPEYNFVEEAFKEEI